MIKSKNESGSEVIYTANGDHKGGSAMLVLLEARSVLLECTCREECEIAY
jgi:hypothetical protein